MCSNILFLPDRLNRTHVTAYLLLIVRIREKKPEIAVSLTACELGHKRESGERTLQIQTVAADRLNINIMTATVDQISKILNTADIAD